MPTPRSGFLVGIICATVASVTNAQSPLLEATPTIGPQLLFEASPTVAVADQQFTDKIRKVLDKSAEAAWTPNAERALAAVARIQSKQGRRDIIAKARPGMHIESSLDRIEKSRFQIFGLIVAGHRSMLIDATPLQSDAPELWLTDCISHHIFDGGAAYWWILVSADSLEIMDCGRRP